ncbi:hypothetical protein KAH37_06870 [bacterium]|nr:hypothetical protein [bacterium]
MDNSFLWDSSTQTIFCSLQGLQQYSLIHSVDKKSFMTHFPPLFLSVFSDVDMEDKKIFIGVGPGSFTGVKSGIAFIGGWLFSKGKSLINTVSSGDILSCYAPPVSDVLAVVIPFNRGEWFVSTYRFQNGHYSTIEKDIHLKKDEDFKRFTDSISSEKLFVASSDTSYSEQFITKMEGNICKKIELADVPFRHPAEEALLQTIDIEKSPLFLNYVLQPAGLSNDNNLYIQTIKEERIMMTDQKNREERIEELKKEHKVLHNDVETFAAKTHRTPHEERELKMWQKKKLMIKDEIAKLEQQ